MKAIAIAVMLLLAVSMAEAQPLKVPKPKVKDIKKWEVSLGLYVGNASVLHDIDGNSMSSLKDSLRPIYSTIDTNEIVDYQDYTFQLSHYTIIPSVRWMPNDSWDISANLAFTQSFLDEKYTYDSVYNQETKKSFSLFQVEYLSLDADYYLLKDNFKLALTGGVSMPFGFDEGQMDTLNSGFLDDGAFEFKAGTKVQFMGNGITIGAGAVYNHRTEDLEPRMIYNLRFGLVSVPGTELSGFFNAYIPFKDQSEMPPVNIRYRMLNEETYQVGFAFKILFDSDMFAETGYRVNLGGKNTLGMGLFFINLGVRY